MRSLPVVEWYVTLGHFLINIIALIMYLRLEVKNHDPLSDQPVGSKNSVFKPFFSLVLKDNFSVRDNTMFVNSPIWRLMSENLRCMLLCSTSLCLLSNSPSSNSTIWALESTSGTLDSLSLSLIVPGSGKLFLLVWGLVTTIWVETMENWRLYC